MFESASTEFNRDSAVIRHELAHATVWFRLGEGVGRLAMKRGRTGQLFASVRAKHADPAQDINDPDFVDRSVVRILAGESAARRHLGMPRDRIAIDHSEADRLTMASSLEDVASLCDDGQADIARVLVLAHRRARATWRAWLRERLQETILQVDACWPAIDELARRYDARMPTPMEGRLIWGTDLIRDIYDVGLVPHGAPPLELLGDDGGGSAGTWLRRCWRRATGRQTRWRRLERAHNPLSSP